MLVFCLDEAFGEDLIQRVNPETLHESWLLLCNHHLFAVAKGINGRVNLMTSAPCILCALSPNHIV